MHMRFLTLRLLALLLTACGAVAVISPVSQVSNQVQRARVESCMLTKTKEHSLYPPRRKSVKSACVAGKYSKSKCYGFKPESLTPGCELLDLWDPRWYELSGGAHNSSSPALEIVMYGDSVSQQLFETLICQMARHAPVEAVQGLYTTPSNPGPGKLPNRCRKHCWGFGAINVCFVRTSFMNAGEGSQQAACLAISRPHDVHVFSGGVHVNTPRDQTQVMESFVKGVKDLAAAGVQLPHLVWQESTPQHFKSPGGNFLSKNHVKKTRACMSTSEIHEPGMRKSNFRGRIQLEHLQSLDIDIFHVWDLLLHRPDLHPSAMDCTHYCDTPNSPIGQVGKLLLSDVLRGYWLGAGGQGRPAP